MDELLKRGIGTFSDVLSEQTVSIGRLHFTGKMPPKTKTEQKTYVAIDNSRRQSLSPEVRDLGLFEPR
jgi:hypothetical protein